MDSDKSESDGVVDEDIWWYICTICNRAFTEDGRLRAHKRRRHGETKSKGLADVRILSQAVDLTPIVKVIRYKPVAVPSMQPWVEEAAGHPDQDCQDHQCHHCLDQFPTLDTLKRHALLIHGPSAAPTTHVKMEIVSPPELVIKVEQADLAAQEDEPPPGIRLRPRKRQWLPTDYEEKIEDDTDDSSGPDTPFVLTSGSSEEDSDSDQSECEERERERIPKNVKNRAKNRQSKFSKVSTLTNDFLRTCPDMGDGVVRCSLCFKLLRKGNPIIYHARSTGHIKHLTRVAEGSSGVCECLVCYQNAFLRPVPHLGGAWECKQCNFPLEESAIRKHMQVKHSNHEMPPIMLQDVQEGLSEWREAKLNPKISPSDVKCVHCDKVYPTNRALLNHMKDIHKPGASAAALICHTCQGAFRSRRALLRHVRRTHLHTRPVDKNHLCSDCGISFCSVGQLREHALRHNPENPRPFKCEICGNSFPSMQLLKSHKLSHQAATVLCTECGKLFKSDRHLRIHQRVLHSGRNSNQFICGECGKDFKHKRSMEAHAAIVHMNETPYPCPKCPEAFQTSTQLGHHRRQVHSGLTHICRVCGKQFPRQRGVLQHELDAHDFQRAEVDKIFKCEHEGCGRKFVTNLLLRQHQTVHNERSLKCEACSKGFKTNHHLDQHKMTHVPYEELPHVCDVCGKRFGWAKSVREHKQKHHGVTRVA